MLRQLGLTQRKGDRFNFGWLNRLIGWKINPSPFSCIFLGSACLLPDEQSSSANGKRQMAKPCDAWA